jgi:hypothetical protein
MDEEKKVTAPVMNRSRSQLATAYAPGAFFTFEGGLGACISLPAQGAQSDQAHISESAKKQVIIRLGEIVRSWFERAMNCRPDDKHQPLPKMCVDPALLHGNIVAPLDRARIEFINPIKMGYAPAPLTFVCNNCGLFKHFKSVKQMYKHLWEFDTDCRGSKHGGKCQWRQLDVIFVHWSGNWEPAKPGMYEWDDREQKLNEPKSFCAQCHSTDFILDTRSPSIGKWFFVCAKCGHPPRDTWWQNDPVTTEILRNEAGQRNSERRMEPISYRASAAFYPQYDQFIVFEDDSANMLALLDPIYRADLVNFIAREYGFGATRPTTAEMKELLEQAGKADKWQRYVDKKKALDQATELVKHHTTGDMVDFLNAQIATMEREMAEIVDSWFSEGHLNEKNELPSKLIEKLNHRGDFSSRYDPFTLAVEHAALRKNKLDASAEASSGRRAFVRFTKLDAHLAPKDAHLKEHMESETRALLDKLGIEEMGLIREFDLCRFTFGFTRVQAAPDFEKREQMMPVRLNLFPSLENNKKPIYAITQANEALYVRLNSVQVYKWLQSINPADMFEWSPEDKAALGAHLLERAVPFGRFLKNLHADGPSSSYLYTYTLLHTYSHFLMKMIAEQSGLDLNSMGEYLFPADLAFVVYRNGTTMDLGYLSSLWRNTNVRLLREMGEPKPLLCNSGTTCDQLSFGACPDCIMVPETSCIVSNQLLSRAVLRGGEPPREDGDNRHKRIPGYLEVVNERTA